MNYKEVINQINQKKVKDYSYTVLFFLIFSIFIVFAIRPNIITAIELRNELIDLKSKDEEYEQLIQKIVEHQTILEAQRTKLYVLDEAIPPKYLMHYVLIDDLIKSASDSGVTLTKLNIPEVVLISKKEEKGLQTVPVTFGMSAPDNSISALFKQFLVQRRLKQIEKVVLNKEKSGTESANLDTDVEINTFYYKL